MRKICNRSSVGMPSREFCGGGAGLVLVIGEFRSQTETFSEITYVLVVASVVVENESLVFDGGAWLVLMLVSSGHE
jgi:hypothetical protein